MREAHSNRRAFTRLPASFQVCCGTVSNWDGYEIGEAGLRFSASPGVYQAGEELEMKFCLAGANHWIAVKSLVRHTEADKVGVEFLNIRRTERLMISDLFLAGA
jgi:hypothetical protein